MQDLFKTRTNKDREDRTKLAQELLDAYLGKLSLKKILFGDVEIEKYSKRGKYFFEKHKNNPCILTQGKSINSSKRFEKRTCKCLFYNNNEFVHKKCNDCVFLDRFKAKNFSILDYEIPSFYKPKKGTKYKNNGIGGIDLVLKYSDDVYATEVKPKYGNTDSLIHMIAEIETYTYGFNGKIAYREGEEGPQFKKAIAFFKGSEQALEYFDIISNKPNSELLSLLQKAEISVFEFQLSQSSPDEIALIKLL